MLHLETVESETFSVLKKLMELIVFAAFSFNGFQLQNFDVMQAQN
jgi:hypothetical protein